MSSSNCRFLALPHPGLAPYRNCIELESNLASLGNEDSVINAWKLYEAALETYDQEASLWKDYNSLETKVSFIWFFYTIVSDFDLYYVLTVFQLLLQLGTSETAAAVYWHARKTIKDSAVFFTSPDQL